MRAPHNIFRLIRTGATFERTGAMNVILDAYQAPVGLRLAAKILGWPFQWLGYKGDPAMPPVTRALTALGPAYIKFGQILSTRPDVVGDELAVQLRVLQDKLPPFPIEEAQKMIEAELERPLASMFQDFSAPVAAASIAQVHRAKLASDGADVAVKVLRPGIERAFRRDIDAFYFAARMVEVLAPGARRLRPLDVIAHFEGVVLGELDLRLESSAAGEFAANTESDEGFQLPQINWSLSGKNVMTMDWAEGISAGDNAALDAAGHDRRRIGERILQLFLSHALLKAANSCFRGLGLGDLLQAPQDSGIALRGGRAMLSAGFERAGWVDMSEIDRQYPILLEAYGADISELTVFYPGALNAVARLRASGYAVAICTNKPEALAVQLMQALNASAYFDALVGAGG
jgi:ubiquinone biosynthesis protein